MKIFESHAWSGRCAVAALAFTCTQAVFAQPAQAQAQAQNKPATPMTTAFGSAIASFRQGQLADAYGRFIVLAHLGHADSARYALLMCEHGLDLFGRDWDCAPHDVEEWASLAGVPAPRIAARHYAPLKSSRQSAAR